MMKSIEKEAKVLEAEPHDIAAIPAASLWELCRDFDAEAGVQLGGNYVGLQIFRHFKSKMKTRRVVAEVAAEMEVVHGALKEEASGNSGSVRWNALR
jgi:hypothetical protein